MQTGLVHVYTGDGKGKTTASVGLCARAAGRGLRVGFFQFLKGGVTGETVSLAKLGVTVLAPPTGKFVWDMDEAEKQACREKQRATLARATELATELDMLVLDEAICASNTGMLPLEELVAFVSSKPAGLELVLTGRDAPQELLELAEYVTEMVSHAHPFDKGIAARKGIEL